MKKLLWPLIISLSAPFISGHYQVNSLPRMYEYRPNKICIDTDYPNYNPFEKGEAITDNHSPFSFPSTYRHPDRCLNTYLLEETFCINNKIKKGLVDCRIFGDFACYSGECVQTNSIPGWNGIPTRKPKVKPGSSNQ